MKTIKFNTGCHYTSEGQIIVATLHDDMIVTFYDHSRMISGEFKLCGNVFNQSIVMDAYLHNISKETARSIKDSVYADSCNRL